MFRHWNQHHIPALCEVSRLRSNNNDRTNSKNVWIIGTGTKSGDLVQWGVTYSTFKKTITIHTSSTSKHI
ncbi:hypothetical protein [Flavobacterium sp. N502540]|uniref:hypothetical protein n=1 Tax=Flavobacterium sp. N502540 TaxID=2986838 RepID=UPI0022257867|nr:hypothetical protein [Flavobacterium sp. N502540]